MPAWNELLQQCEALPSDEARGEWLVTELTAALGAVRSRRGNRNVILYASGFLQKPNFPPAKLQISFEDINGFMSVMYGMNWAEHLTLILHTPGGALNATETIVSYLMSKFADIEVIVPAFAMSGGTMISLAANRIIMSRAGQLGPTDPQMFVGGLSVSAGAIVKQFEQAKEEILANVAAAHVWAPVLQSLGPALLQEAQNALGYSQEMVKEWLVARMLAADPKAAEIAETIAAYFTASSTHKSHGRRIDCAEALAQGVQVSELEQDQHLQDAVLTAYHLMTIVFEKSPATKMICSHAEKRWIKNADPSK